MTSQPGSETILTHIKISRSKGSRKMKFGQLKECNMRNIFHQKSYAKFCEETSHRPFSEKQKLNIYLDQQPEMLCSLFLLYGQLSAIEIY